MMIQMVQRVILDDTVEVLGGPAVFGHAVRSNRDLDLCIREGLPVSALRYTIEALGESESAIVSGIGMSRSTLTRRKRNGTGRLGLTESERTVRLGRIAAMGRVVLGSTAAAGRWLLKPNKALGGAVPLSLLQTDVGAREVEAVLGRALHGGYS